MAIPILLIVALLIAYGWSYRLAGWRRFAEADERWRTAGAPDDLEKLLASQPCDESVTARWFAWREKHASIEAADELLAYADELYESITSGRDLPRVPAKSYTSHGPAIEDILSLLTDPGWDPSHSGRRHIADRLQLPTSNGPDSQWTDWQKLPAHRMVQCYLFCKVASTPDGEQARTALRLMDAHVDRLAEADTLLDAMVRIAIGRRRDLAWLSCLGRIDRLDWPETAFNDWLDQTVPHLAELPTVMRRDRLWEQRIRLVTSRPATGFWTLIGNGQRRKEPLATLRLWLQAGYHAADLSDAARRWDTWQPMLAPAPPRPERTTLAKLVGVYSQQEATITCWEEDARQRAVRLAARVLLRRRTNESLPSDHQAWLQRYPAAVGATGRASLRYERLAADSFRIGIDPAGPLVWPGIASRYTDRWLITWPGADPEPPPRSRRERNR